MQLLKQLYDLFIIKFIFGNFNILIFAFVNLSKMTEQIFDNIYIYIYLVGSWTMNIQSSSATLDLEIK